LTRRSFRAVFALAVLALLAGCTTITLDENGRLVRVDTQWFPPYIPPPVNYSLTVTKAGAGTGTVQAPPQINCGATCTSGYAIGATVTLTATPSAGSTFTSWSGACSGTASACTITMNSAKTATATFAATASDTTPPAAVSPVAVIGSPTLGPTSASYPVTWTAALDQPCNCPVSTYAWDVNNLAWNAIIAGPGTTTTTGLTLIVPYDPTGASVVAHFGVSAVDLAGNPQAGGHTWTDFIIPANPATNAKLTAAWIAPTLNTDGSPLNPSTDLQGYRVYYAAGSSGSPNPCPGGAFITAGPGLTSAVITGLTNSTSYIASLVSVNLSGTASACSATATGVAHP
jgi:hypothetical protein